jgi:hypothetical protein
MPDATSWLPIETAPKDGTLFLCWVSAVQHGESDEGQQYQVDVSQADFCQWHAFEEAADGGWFEPCCGHISDQQAVTHWMPLPPAPGASSSPACNGMSAESEREAFEVAMAREGYETPASRYRDGTYRSNEYAAGWAMWQAARATPPAPAPEPARPDILEKLTYHALERDDLTLDDALEYLARGWTKIHGRTERQLILQLTALLAGAPPAPGGGLPEGWVAAPVEPTEAIRSAGVRELFKAPRDRESWEAVMGLLYTAMISARPTPGEKEG